MNSTYTELLRVARKNIEAVHPLITSRWSYRGPGKLKRSSITIAGASSVAPVKNSTSESSVTEKIKSLDALNLFENKDTVAERETKTSVLEAITPKSESLSAGSMAAIEFELKTVPEIKQDYSGMTYSTEANIDILFITDDTVSDLIEYPNDSSIPATFNQYFEEQVALLFYKMTQAMKLEDTDFSISSLSIKSKQKESRLESEIWHLRPRLIMTLGAQAYQFFNSSNARLKDIHGQIQDVNLMTTTESGGREEFKTKLMPIFSPSLLQTAPNMKKTAWLDMQKAMEYLK